MADIGTLTPEFVRHARICVTHRTDPSRTYYIPFEDKEGVPIKTVIQDYFTAMRLPDTFSTDTYKVSIALLKRGTVPEGRTFEDTVGHGPV